MSRRIALVLSVAALAGAADAAAGAAHGAPGPRPFNPILVGERANGTTATAGTKAPVTRV